MACNALTLEEVTEGNLLPNPTLAPANARQDPHTVRSWTEHPSASPLVRPREGMLELAPGAAALSLTSRNINITPGEAYTLALDIKQENIHYGFDMGTRILLIWYRDAGARTPERLDLIDGSFDWQTKTYSVVAPEGATRLQIRLSKMGSPGTVYLRNARLAKGTLKTRQEEMSIADFVRCEASFAFLRSHLRDLMADKAALAIPGSKERLARLEAKIASNITSVQAGLQSRGLQPSEKERREVIWTEMLRGNVGFRIPPGLPFYEAWQALEKERADLTAFVQNWIDTENPSRLHNAMRATFGSAPGYSVGVSSTMLKTRRDAPYLGPVAAEASIALAREEEESVQITLAALEAPLKNVALSTGSFKNAQGQQLPEHSISIHRIDFVQTEHPQYFAAGPVGWWPDVVFPANTAAEIAQEENQAFWITVAPDHTTPPGDYTGTVQISIEGKPAQSVALTIRVWDFTLPRPGKFEVVGCFHPYMLTNFYRWKKPKENVVADWARFIVRKRWNPTLYFANGLTPNGSALTAALEEGLNAINLFDPSKQLTRDDSRTYNWPTAEQEQAIRDLALKSKEEFVAAGGDPKKTQLYFMGFDEQHDREQYALMKHVFSIAKEVVPEAKTYTSTTYAPLDGLAGAVNAWTPLLGSESDDLLARQAAGDDLHFYVYAMPFRPYPNPSLIDYHGADSRVTFWLAATKGYKGFFHYLFNGWKMNNDLPGPRWPETPWVPYSSTNQKNRNGAGYFLYPGPDEQPIASVRMELVRDGIEDWEMITLLREAIAKTEATSPDAPALADAKKTLAEALAIAPALDTFTLDMDRLLSTRNRVAEAILSLK